MNQSNAIATSLVRVPKPFWRNGLNVRQTFFVGLMLGILVPALALAVFQISRKFDSEINLRVRAPLQQYADVLARGVAVALWNFDTGVASELMDAVLRNPDVVRITVRGNGSKVFLNKESSTVHDVAPLVELRDISYNAQSIGSLSIEMTTRRVVRQFWREQLGLVLALVAQVLITFGLVWILFKRRLLKPLQRLQRDAQRLSRGEMTEPLQWERSDEMGALAQGLDAMRADIAQLLNERQARTQQLEQELQQRKRIEGELQHSQRKFSAIFEASPVAMAVAWQEAPYEIVDVNSAWVRVFGRMRTEVIGSNEDALGLWKEQRVRQHALGLLARDGELTRFGAWMSAGMGRTDMLCEVSGRAITLGTQSLTIMAYEDVTDAHEYEEKILSLNAGLEQRVDERTRELSDTLQRLTTTQADLIRSEKLSALGSLVAGIAHELNTPIGNSLTVASTLQDQVRALDSHMKAGLRRSDLEGFLTQGREGVDILMRSLEHAAELVASFKQVAVDQTSVKRRNFDLRETVQELLHTLGPSLRKTPYTVQVAIPPGIRLDSYPGPLCQVITNLVNNAVVHAFDGRSEGTIEIQAKVQAQLKGGEHVVIHVQDNGRGIAPAHLAKVFDPFFTTRLGLGGSGLGLNIVYNLVHKTLGGTIAVDSMLGYGACFTLTLAMVAPELKDTE